MNMINTNRVPSPVDWSEFHLWCYQLADVQKRTMKTVAIRAKRGYEAATNVGMNLNLSQNETSSKLFITSSQTVQDGAAAVASVRATVLTNAYVQLSAGAIGGGTATYTTHWLDTIKVKMQAFPQVHSTGVGCLKHTLKEEGVRGLYQGATPALVGQTAKAAIVFMSYGICEELVKKMAGRERSEDLTAWHHASAGAMTGVLATLFLCPVELIKCRQQAIRAKPGRVRRTSWRMAQDVVKKDGVRGLYRGLNGMWAKDIPGSFIYFGSYEMSKIAVRHLNGTPNLNSGEVFFCGVTAGLFFSITFPLESVRTRVQVVSALSETTGFLRTFRYIIQNEGVRPLVNGFKPSILRASIYSGVQFLTYELFKERLLPPPEGDG